MNDMIDVRPGVEPVRSAGGNTAYWILTFVLAIAGLGIVFRDGLVFMAEHWDTEEYSHGSLIPIIAAFLIWQQNRFTETKDGQLMSPRDVWNSTQIAGDNFFVVKISYWLGVN